MQQMSTVLSSLDDSQGKKKSGRTATGIPRLLADADSVSVRMSGSVVDNWQRRQRRQQQLCSLTVGIESRISSIVIGPLLLLLCVHYGRRDRDAFESVNARLWSQCSVVISLTNKRPSYDPSIVCVGGQSNIPHCPRLD